MSLQYRVLDRYPGLMSSDELRAALPLSLEKSVIMRSLLLAELDRCKKEYVEPRTLRSLWYDLIKPALSQLGLLDPPTYFYYVTADGRKGKKPKGPYKAGKLAGIWADDLSKYLAELVRLGACTYAELNIKDSSRPRRNVSPYAIALETVEVVGVHHPEIIIFTEKTTIYDELEALASIYGISAISGSGEPSFACTENLIDGIEQRITEPVTLRLVELTDYDPAGYTIFNTQHQQLSNVIYSREMFKGVAFDRIGLHPYQLTEQELAIKTYQPPATGLSAWYKETGGVNGEMLGLELDVLPESRRRLLFVNALSHYIGSERPYHDDLRRALIKMLVNEALEDHTKVLRDTLANSIKGREKELTCGDDTIHQAALAGRYYVDPRKAFSAAAVADLGQVLNDKAEEIV